VRIEGDVQLAAEVNWLVDHVRWDMEEDLSRLMGDAPAHAWDAARARHGQACASSWGACPRQGGRPRIGPA
jgi:ubiquinone biosynthesis protein UbiJ